MYDDSPPPNLCLDIEQMIEEIKKRPVLWDRQSTEYNDRVLKMKLWEEVHEAVFEDWTELGSAEKRIRSEEVKKKWRNIRDTYAKELLSQRRAKKGKIRKKIPYRYTEHLKFLSEQFRERISKDPSSEESSDDEYLKTKSKNIVIDAPTLIEEVKKRPVLWNRQSHMSERHERDTREKLWEEVCEVIFDNWGELGSTAKSLRATEVKKKWRNLRDSYGRELGKQRKADLGLLKRKKPYRFFSELSFLFGTLEKRNDDDYSLVGTQEIDIEVPSSNYSLSEYEDNMHESVEEPKAEPKKKEIIVKTYDEDICFTEMLVPMLKKLNDDQKHYAQVKILNVLRRARQFDPLGTIGEKNIVMVKNEFANT